jgi:hypothetical protein
MTDGKQGPGFCGKHRSSFCPCVRPDWYAPTAAEMWDEAERRYREREEARRDRRPEA